MRLNRYLASSLLAGLFVTASFFTPAMGQEQSLQPQGAWAISKIDKSAQGGNSYCTLSRKYDNGAVLSLGRNQTEEYSLAIDFQKPTFEKDKSLKINLQPGPGQIRAYDMMPTSDKAVVVRLGWDTGFFDALNKSQQMKVKIGDKNYAFAMPEITKGQGDLQECMEGLQASAKDAKGAKTASATKDVLNADPKASKDFDAGKVDGKVAAATPAPAPVAALAPAPEKVAEEEKSALQKFAESIKPQESAQNDEDAPKRRNFASKGEEGSDVKPEGKADIKTSFADKTPEAKTPAPMPPVAEKEEPTPAPEQAKHTTQSPVTTAAKEEAPAAAKMAAMSPAAAFEKDEAAQKALQKQIDDLKAQNDALKNKPAAPSPELQQQLASVQAEKAALQQKLAAAQQDKSKAPKPEEIAATEGRIKELEAKNAQLEDSLRQAQVRIGETAINTETKSIRRITELESKLQAAQDDNTALAKQLESFRMQQEDKSVKAIAGDWDLEQATKRYNEAEREIRRLGLQLEQERTSCNREKAQIEQMLFDPAVADQKQIERLSQLEDQLDAAQAKINDQQKLVQAQVDQQVAQKTQSLGAEKAGLTAQIASLQKSLADRDASIATLQKTATDAQTAQADKQKLTQQIASMQTLITSKDTAITQKDGEIAALKTAPKADPAQITALQAQVKTLTDTLAAKDKTVGEAQAAVSMKEKAALDAQAAIAAKDKALADAQNALKAAQAEAAKPKADPAQMTALQAQLAALQGQNKTLMESMAAKDKAVADAQAALKSADQARAAAVAAAAQPKTDPAVLKQIADLQSSMSAIKADNDALRDQNIVLRQDADKLRIQLTDAQTNGGARADQLASLQLQIDTLKRQAATKDTQLATYQNQLAAAQQDSAQLKNRLSVADNVRTSSTDEVGSLTRQVQQLQKQINDMQAEKSRAPDRSAMADTYAGITPAAGYVSPAPIAPVQAQPVAVATPAAVPAASAISGYDKGAIQSLLQKSGLGASVSKTGSGFAGADNFSWSESNNVKGLASVKILGGGSFDDMVNQYIAYQKGQCSGDFASMPSPSNGSAAKKMSLYEVACVGSGGQNQSASLLFFEDQGRFIAIANQIDAANMDVAMDSRDKIAGFVRGL